MATPSFPPRPRELFLWRTSLGVSYGDAAWERKLAVPNIQRIEGSDYNWDHENADRAFDKYVDAIKRAHARRTERARRAQDELRDLQAGPR